MENGTKNYLRIIALVLGMLVLTALAVADQSTEQATLIPRPVMRKPVHTIVNDSDHQTGKITVKFREGLLIRMRDGKLTDFGTGALLGAEDVLAGAGGTWRRVHSVAEAKLDEWRVTAQNNLVREVGNLNLYFNLHLPAGADAGATIDALNGLDCVEYALPVPLPSPPPGGCGLGCLCAEGEYCEDQICVDVPDFEPLQGYLDAAPDGIDAKCAWMVPGGTGAGIKIVDIETGWNLDHCDLNATVIGPPPVASTEHGTNVLGEFGSINNGWGTTGIAYDSTIYVATHCYAVGPPEPHCDTTDEVAAAISRAIDLGNLGPGDVIILEVQIEGPKNNVPAEWFEPTYAAIQTAVGLGVVVVEAAGNGTQNLDAPIFCDGGCGQPPPAPFCPFCPEQDSGAIIVGAGNSPSVGAPGPDRARTSGSNYGSTVDLQGWGDSIVTTGLQLWFPALLDEENLEYTDGFGLTSGASPIVAGACALLQSAYKQATGTVLTPQQVRDFLRDTGSPQQPSDPPFCGPLPEPSPECENIGPRPNLAAAISAAVPSLDGNCNAVPDACECPADLNGDGEVEAADLAILLGSWGDPGCGGELPCPADLNCDGAVEAADLAILLGSWGPCGGLGGGGESAPPGPGGDDAALIEALGVMGFADVDEFNAWTASVPTDEAHAATQKLLELLTE